MPARISEVRLDRDREAVLAVDEGAAGRASRIDRDPRAVLDAGADGDGAGEVVAHPEDELIAGVVEGDARAREDAETASLERALLLGPGFCDEATLDLVAAIRGVRV